MRRPCGINSRTTRRTSPSGPAKRSSNPQVTTYHSFSNLPALIRIFFSSHKQSNVIAMARHHRHRQAVERAAQETPHPSRARSRHRDRVDRLRPQLLGLREVRHRLRQDRRALAQQLDVAARATHRSASWSISILDSLACLWTRVSSPPGMTKRGAAHSITAWYHDSLAYRIPKTATQIQV